jgi:flavin reductase (DIM6/NTAB) family NADH-FMN oxidoreductase RutF
MLQEVALSLAYRVTPTGLYLISTAHEEKRNVQFAFRALGISDDPALILVGIQANNFSRGLIQKSREFVVNVCSENPLHSVNRSRDLSGRDVEDKFRALGLAPISASRVKAPSWRAATLTWSGG